MLLGVFGVDARGASGGRGERVLCLWVTTDRVLGSGLGLGLGLVCFVMRMFSSKIDFHV